HGQHAHAVHPVGPGVVVLGEMVVVGAGHGQLPVLLAQLGHAAGAGGEAHGVLHIVVLGDALPGVHLFGGAHIPAVDHARGGGMGGVVVGLDHGQLVVPRLIA